LLIQKQNLYYYRWFSNYEDKRDLNLILRTSVRDALRFHKFQSIGVKLARWQFAHV